MYKIRIILDTKEDVIRTILFDADINLENLHRNIAKSFGFKGQEMASFYRTDSEWTQGEEIPLFNMEESGEGISMETCILKDVLPQEDDKLIYVYDFLKMWTFYVEVIEISDEKRKAPDFVLTNQDSILISNDDMLGKVYVLEFFFTRCPDICIEMNKNMKILDNEFGDRDDFGIASFTIDPDHDTPKVLKEYSELLEVKSKNWHFLTGDVTDIYDLSNSGFNIFSIH